MKYLDFLDSQLTTQQDDHPLATQWELSHLLQLKTRSKNTESSASTLPQQLINMKNTETSEMPEVNFITYLFWGPQITYFCVPW